jgi:hypothetical protein
MAREWVAGRNAVLLVGDPDDALSAMTVVVKAMDVEVSFDGQGEDSTTRENGRWNAEAIVGITATITGTIQYAAADDGFGIIRDAFLNGDLIQVCALSGPVATAGSEGPLFIGQVKNFGRQEPIGGVQKHTFEIVLDEFIEWIEDGAITVVTPPD